MSSYADGIAIGQRNRAQADADYAHSVANANANKAYAWKAEAEKQEAEADALAKARADDFNGKQTYRAALDAALADVVVRASSERRLADALFRIGLRRAISTTNEFGVSAGEVAAMDLRYRTLSDAIRDNLTSQDQKLAMKREMEELRAKFPAVKVKRDTVLAQANKTIHDNLLALNLLPEQRREVEAGYNALADLVAKHPELKAEADALRMRHQVTLAKRDADVAAENAEYDASAQANFDKDYGSREVNDRSVQNLLARGQQGAAGLTVSGSPKRNNANLLPERQIPPARIDDPERVFPPEPAPEPEEQGIGSRIMGFFR